jgi:predicted permease
VALTIALATTVFAVVDGVLFKPLPYPAADRLFNVVGSSGRTGEGTASLAAGDVAYLAFADSRIAVTGFGNSSVTLIARPDLTVWAATVDEHFFEVVGLQPLVGGFTTDHYTTPTSAGPRPAIVSHAFWQQWLGADSAVIGTTVPVIGAPLLIVGVLPQDFVFPLAFGRARPDVLFPRSQNAADDRWNRSLSAVARIRDNITLEEARARLGAALAAHVDEYRPLQVRPGPYTAVVMRPLGTYLGAVERPLFRLAFLGAGLLIVLGAFNAAGLLAARAFDRQREMTIRVALGGGRQDVARVFLAEALVVAITGTVAGLTLAVPLVAVVIRLLPESLLLLKTPAVDWRVTGFAILTSCAVATVLGLVPAIAASRRALSWQMSRGGSVTPQMQSRGRDGVLVAQGAIGIALVVTGSLLLAGYVTLRSENPGFDAEHLGVLEVRTPDIVPPAEFLTRQNRVFDRLRQVPGIERVATVGVPVLENVLIGTRFRPQQGVSRFSGHDIPVSGAFFQIAGLTLLDGRFPTETELDEGQLLAVVSEATARANWPEGRAVGQTLTSPDQTLTVIGVVEEARIGIYDDSGEGEIYLPASMARTSVRVFLLRTTDDPERVLRDAAAAVRRDVPGVLIRRAESFESAISRSIRLHTFRTVLFTTFALAGLTVLAVAIAGIAATAVARRVREIGIRSALGAQRHRLVAMVVFDHLRPTTVGVSLGLLLSWWTTTVLRAYVYSVDVHEPAVWVAATVVVLGITLGAAWIPARRAGSLDPMLILRAE